MLLAVAKRGSLFKVLRLNRRFLFQPNVFDFLLDFLNIRWPRHGVDARPGPGFIHHIDCFVGQETASDVTVGKSNRGLERFVGEFRFVMRLVFRTQTFQNLDRFIDCRSIDLHRLETAFQRGVFLDVLAIFVHGRGSNTLQLSTT